MVKQELDFIEMSVLQTQETFRPSKIDLLDIDYSDNTIIFLLGSLTFSQPVLFRPLLTDYVTEIRPTFRLTLIVSLSFNLSVPMNVA